MAVQECHIWVVILAMFLFFFLWNIQLELISVFLILNLSNVFRLFILVKKNCWVWMLFKWLKMTELTDYRCLVNFVLFVFSASQTFISSTWNQTSTVSGRLSAKHPVSASNMPFQLSITCLFTIDLSSLFSPSLF